MLKLFFNEEHQMSDWNYIDDTCEHANSSSYHLQMVLIEIRYKQANGRYCAHRIYHTQVDVSPVHQLRASKSIVYWRCRGSGDHDANASVVKPYPKGHFFLWLGVKQVVYRWESKHEHSGSVEYHQRPSRGVVYDHFLLSYERNGVEPIEFWRINRFFHCFNFFAHRA